MEERALWQQILVLQVEVNKKNRNYLFHLILFVFIIVGGYFIYFIVSAIDLDPDKLDVSYAAQLYDQDGNQFADMGEENRVKVNYDDLPEELIDAVVATEDSRFYK